MSQPKPVTNPNWYEGDVAEEDSKLKLIYPQRRIIYSTEEPVILAPTEFQDPGLVCTPPADRHLTVNAVDVILAGTIAIPRGDIRIVCRTLKVWSGVPATIDVQPKLGTKYLVEGRPCAGAAPPKQPAGSTAEAKSGAELKALDAESKHGTPGGDGGTITIICDVLSLEASLTLQASGGDGYPGFDGQDGANGVDGQDGEILDTHDTYGERIERVRSTATVGTPGKKGGDALSGGSGGKGGRILFQYYRLAQDENGHDKGGEDKVTIRVDGGSSGRDGLPGKGGTSGRGGKNIRHGRPVHEHAVVVDSQEHPTDDEPLPVAESGKPSTVALQGSGGYKRMTLQLKDLSPLGQYGDDVFFLMMLQATQYRYLNCNPQKFTQSTTYTRGDEREWKAIGKDLAWCGQVLQSFLPDRARDDPGTKKHALARRADILGPYRHQKNRTYYGDLASWVPRATFTSLMTQFNAAIEACAKLESTYYQLATTYQKKTEGWLEQLGVKTTLEDALAVNKSVYDALIKKIPDLKEAVNAEIGRYTKAQEKLKVETANVETAIKQYFHVDLETLLRAAEMLVFVTDIGKNEAGNVTGVGKSVAMGIVQAVSVLNESLGKIKTSDGGNMDKELLLSRIKSLTAGVTNVTPDTLGDHLVIEPQIEQTVQTLASLATLDETFDNLRGAVATDGAKKAVQDFRDALVARTEAIAAYDSTIVMAYQALSEADDDQERLKALRRKGPELKKNDVRQYAHYAQRYQDQVERVLYILYQLERKFTFLTLGFEHSMKSQWESWLKLWSEGGAGDHKTDEFLKTANGMVAGLETYYGLQSEEVSHFPDEKDNVFRLSEVFARLPPKLVTELKTKREKPPYYRVEFALVPEGTVKSDRCVAVANTTDKHALQISRIRPHVVGAGTASKKLQVHARNDGGCWLQCDGKKFVFTHNPANAAFIHFTSFKPDAPYVAAHTGDEGLLAGEGGDGRGLDLVGLYGNWSLELRPTENRDNTNFDLDVSGISDVFVYFKGCYRTH